MTPRDARGRFTTAQHADALAGDTETVRDMSGRVAFSFRSHDRAEVERILRAAGESADLLLRSAS